MLAATNRKTNERYEFANVAYWLEATVAWKAYVTCNIFNTRHASRCMHAFHLAIIAYCYFSYIPYVYACIIINYTALSSCA